MAESKDLTKAVREARVAARAMAALSAADREKALSAMRASLEQARDVIEECNRKDKANAKTSGLADSLLKRLDVEGKKFNGMLSKVDEVKAVPDPLGVVSRATELDDGLDLYRVACPIGVICVIFESRPEAAVQIASLTVRSGNAVILKGGKEAANTNAALVAAMQGGLSASGVVPAGAVQLVSTREEIAELLSMHGQIDLIVPRGSNELVSHIMQNTSIPVLGHADGICSVYLDESADVQTAVRVAVDSKMDYPVACNAAEKLVVHRGALKTALPAVGEALLSKGVELRADEASFAELSARAPAAVREGKLKRAAAKDFRTEYGGLTMAVKVVENVGDAAVHINEHSSHHTDCIVAADSAAVEYFMDHIDSAGVYANASTRFADGQRYGFGAEVGVSTNRIHSRGPVGVEGLLIYKYKLYGKGQIVAEYSSGAKSFKHAPLPLPNKGAKPELRLGPRGVLLVAAAAAAWQPPPLQAQEEEAAPPIETSRLRKRDQARAFLQSQAQALETALEEARRAPGAALSEALEGARRAPQAFSGALEGARRAPEALGEALEGARRAPEAFSGALEGARRAPEALGEVIEKGRAWLQPENAGGAAQSKGQSEGQSNGPSRAPMTEEERAKAAWLARQGTPGWGPPRDG